MLLGSSDSFTATRREGTNLSPALLNKALRICTWTCQVPNRILHLGIRSIIYDSLEVWVHGRETEALFEPLPSSFNGIVTMMLGTFEVRGDRC